jgi:hypothetical protein
MSGRAPFVAARRCRPMNAPVLHPEANEMGVGCWGVACCEAA